jgi:hypothetical protein
MENLPRILAPLCFGIAVLMHVFGWGSHRVDYILFALLGLLFLSLSPWRASWWPARSQGNP